MCREWVARYEHRKRGGDEKEEPYCSLLLPSPYRGLEGKKTLLIRTKTWHSRLMGHTPLSLSPNHNLIGKVALIPSLFQIAGERAVLSLLLMCTLYLRYSLMGKT